MSEEAVTTRLRAACDYQAALDRPAVPMDPESVEARLQELAEVSWLCVQLERAGKALGTRER